MFRKQQPGLAVGGRIISWQVLCQGLFVTGKPGSGKSHFLLSLIRQLVGVTPLVITTTKPADYDDIEAICREKRQLDRLVRLGKGSSHRLGLGECFTAMIPGGSARMLARVLQMIGDVLNNAKGAGGGERFWDQLIQDTLYYSTQLAVLATGQVQLSDVLNIIYGLPNSPEDMGKDGFYTGNPCGIALVQAKGRRKPETDHILKQCVEFAERIGCLGEKARGAAI